MNIKIITVLILISCNPFYTQVRELSSQSYYKQGDIEFSFSSGLGKNFGTSSVIVFDSYSSQTFTSEIDLDQMSSFLSASAGYYIINGLSVEPEIKIGLTDDIPSVILIGGLSYTFFLPLKDLAPYIKLGYGWAIADNQSSYYYNTDEAEGYSVIKGAFGIKFRYTSTVAVKLEINYLGMNTEYSYSDNYISYLTNSKTETHHKIISFSVGIFILL